MIIDRYAVTDKVAVVTGAGRGIGAASALALAEAGADVVIGARTESQLSEVAAQVRALGRRAVTVTGDLSDLDVVASLATTAQAEFGRLDIVVNNVGGTTPLPFLDTGSDLMEEAFHFNVTTAHALLEVAVPIMLAGQGGSIVNISSVMGRIAGRGFLAYGTAKAALAHYTKLASKDLAPRIRVNAVAPGSIATSALDGVLTDDGLRTAMERATPLRRIAAVDEIASVVLFLASDGGSFVTGQVIFADGGIDVPNLDMGLPDL